jgi:hypothetical protein
MTSNESREFDPATIRDIVESAHIATKEPEGVTYAEVDAGGVEVLWCIPAPGPTATTSGPLPLNPDIFPSLGLRPGNVDAEPA